MKLWPFCAERRADQRREANLAAEFVVRESFSGKLLSSSCSAQVLNLSRRGCCLALSRLDCGGFHLHRCLEAPHDYLLELNINPHNGASRQVTAELLWLNREQDSVGLPFRAGLAFSEQPRH